MPDVTCGECRQRRMHAARGMCRPCYDRHRHAGRLEDVKPKRTFEEWLAEIDQDAVGCWLWPGPVDSDGYGRCGGDSLMAHRVVYKHLVGPVDDALHLDHLCRVHQCVRPDHLEPVPPATNILRGVGTYAINKRKIKCKRGHSLVDPVNVRITKAGHRSCVQCNRDRCAAWYQTRRVSAQTSS